MNRKAEETSKRLDEVEGQRVFMESELSSVQQAYDEAKAGVEQSAEDIAELEKIREELTGNIATLDEERSDSSKISTHCVKDRWSSRRAR